MNLNTYLKTQAQTIDRALKAYLPKPTAHPKRLSQAMHYAVFSGGKRIRPILCLAAAEAAGDPQKAMPAACALELIHSYSLIHDDLPCMDNDDFRRGKATCHKKFDEATALLAGDALLTLAFTVVSDRRNFRGVPDKRILAAARVIADASGCYGMVGGQSADLRLKAETLDLPSLDYVHAHKTGALIAASVRTGALLAGANLKTEQAIDRFGKRIGFLFQIVDDILDGDGYVKIVGAHEARDKASELKDQALSAIKPLGPKAGRLRQIAQFIYERKS